MFLISLVSVLVLSGTSFATDFTWEGESPYSVLWCDPLNWDPLEPYGPDGCDDTAAIPSGGANPTVVITEGGVGEVKGPAWDSGELGDHEILLVEDANLTTCGHWLVEKTLPYTAYITLQDRARVEIGDRFLAHGEDQRVVIDLSDDAVFLVTNDLRAGDGDGDYFELNMSGSAYLYAGNDDDGFRQNEGELHVSLSGNAILEAEYIRWRMRSDDVTCTLDISENAQVIVNDDHFQFAGGSSNFVLNVTDNASMDIAGEFRGGEDDSFDATYTVNMSGQALIYIGEKLNFIDDDDADGFGQVNLTGGTINCEGLRSETDNWNLDICGGVLIIRDADDATEDILDYVDSGNITGCFGCGTQGTLMIDYNSVEETTTVWVEVDTSIAYDPDPPCGEECGGKGEAVQPDICLSWTAGEGEVLSHAVFLDTDKDKVCSGNLSALVAILPPEETTYCPGPLTLGASYWWRVDEIRVCGVSEGQCWCFDVVDCMIVEDMESYDESCTENAVWEVWKDGAGDCNGIGGNGTGSSVYLATAPVHGGDQSMEYMYESTGSERECAFSEAKKTFDPPLNLVDNFEKAMVLWFYGDADNDTESMWVVLSDGAADAQSTYGIIPPDSPDDIKVEDWMDWNIDVQDQLGSINLANVESFSIGFGPRGRCDGEYPDDPMGTVFFDDITLCTTICVPRYAPDGDLTDDCVVDWDDVKVISDSWLEDLRD